MTSFKTALVGVTALLGSIGVFGQQKELKPTKPAQGLPDTSYISKLGFKFVDFEVNHIKNPDGTLGPEYVGMNYESRLNDQKTRVTMSEFDIYNTKDQKWESFQKDLWVWQLGGENGRADTLGFMQEMNGDKRPGGVTYMVNAAGELPYLSQSTNTNVVLPSKIDLGPKDKSKPGKPDSSAIKYREGNSILFFQTMQSIGDTTGMKNKPQAFATKAQNLIQKLKDAKIMAGDHPQKNKVTLIMAAALKSHRTSPAPEKK